MEADKTKWNERHGCKSGHHAPDKYLIKNLSRLKPGHALDLACGRGRNAFYLAENGFQVTAADISDTGLNVLAKEALKRGLEIRCCEADFDLADHLFPLHSFDTVIIINFKPAVKLLRMLPSLLTSNGILLWCSYNNLQAEISGFPIDLALNESEFSSGFKGLILLDYSRFEDETGFRDGYLFIKSQDLP
ncbi:MAG: methyltransferase domain-containing protein [Bacteroidetes bacterium]|nr:methyltransferase domain-containing protein [Bacteroidota bacterium]